MKSSNNPFGRPQTKYGIHTGNSTHIRVLAKYKKSIEAILSLVYQYPDPSSLLSELERGLRDRLTELE